jgi:hypothetical protein
MRVGELKPDLFGNNNVMPVQMSETAIAFFKMGMPEPGIGLLKSCGLATSVFTESPGSAPERLNMEGNGEANYMFGNPAAAFPYAVICGLFGISVKDYGKTLCYAPARLEMEMSITLPYAEFKAHGNYYSVRLSGETVFENIEFSHCVPPFVSLTLLCNGKNIEFSQTPLFNCVRISANMAMEKEIEISIQGLWADADDLLRADKFGNGIKSHVLTLSKDRNIYIDNPIMPKSENVKRYIDPAGSGTSIDISSFFNSNCATASNCWRQYADYPIVISDSDTLTAGECVYSISITDTGGTRLCLWKKEEAGRILDT